MSDKTELEQALEQGAIVGEPKMVSARDIPYAVVPSGTEMVSLEKLLAAPFRKRGMAQMTEVASFIRYVNDHKTEGTAVFMTVSGTSSPVFTGCIDYHGKETGELSEPGWREHVARFNPVFSEEWNAWMAVQGQQKDQEQFALFIEQRQLDIQTPSGADLLELTTNLQATTTLDLRQAITLQSGLVQVSYDEKQTTASKGTEVTIPKELALAIPVYRGGKRYALTARLRYRIHGRKMLFWTEVMEIPRTLDYVNTEFCDAVAKQTGITPYVGSYS